MKRGLLSVLYEAQTSSAWAEWRAKVYRRDNFTCVMCRKPSSGRQRRGRKIEPHHILRKVDRPDLIFDVDNGVTLCQTCHAKVTGEEDRHARKFQRYVRALKTPAINIDTSDLSLDLDPSLDLAGAGV